MFFASLCISGSYLHFCDFFSSLDLTWCQIRHTHLAHIVTPGQCVHLIADIDSDGVKSMSRSVDHME